MSPCGSHVLSSTRRRKRDGSRAMALTPVEFLQQQQDGGHVHLMGVRVRVCQFIGTPETDVVRRYDTVTSGKETWHNLAVQEGPGRRPVQQQEGLRSVARSCQIERYTITKTTRKQA
ncbi:hypothetical protein E2C01_078405 [Portunus trituberculatus]|uniref:Uncharacterized protein n=1 Tax=Portunus trituberculatus TaxID=210409 RepID=A0A5B7IE81_PORTR|nr:hypothetical protein [Portunus trituberculatus]